MQIAQGSAWRAHSLERRGTNRATRQGCGARRARKPASSRHCRQGSWPRRSAPARVQGVWSGGSRQCACAFRGTSAKRRRCPDRRHGHSAVVANLKRRRLFGQPLVESLDRAGITCNRCEIPFDEVDATLTSGLRFGASACTTRGLRRSSRCFVSLVGLSRWWTPQRRALQPWQVSKPGFSRRLASLWLLCHLDTSKNLLARSSGS